MPALQNFRRRRFGNANTANGANALFHIAGITSANYNS
jgi:predicted aconitase